MRVFAVVLALSVMLMAAPTFAQAPAAQQPAAPAPQAAAAPKPVFQEGLKYGYVRIDVVAQVSSEGKALAAKVQGFQEQKAKELNDRNRQLQTAADKLEKQGSVMSDQARQQLQLEIEKLQRDIQRASEDAQQDLERVQQQAQGEFFQKVLPAIESVAKAKGVHFIFNASESGLVWADPSLELTAEVIAELDTASKTAK